MTVAADQVIARFRRACPQLSFTVERTSLRVALEATLGAGGERGVVVHEGFLRHQALGPEALAIALAHEVAHHDVTGPKTDVGLCREQWADYRGVRDVLPRVWGAAAAGIAAIGVSQLERFWRVGEARPSGQPTVAIDYPSPACRIATFRAAINRDPCPAPF